MDPSIPQAEIGEESPPLHLPPKPIDWEALIRRALGVSDAVSQYLQAHVEQFGFRVKGIAFAILVIALSFSVIAAAFIVSFGFVVYGIAETLRYYLAWNVGLAYGLTGVVFLIVWVLVLRSLLKKFSKK